MESGDHCKSAAFSLGYSGFNQAEIGFTMHTKKTFISWVGRADLDGQDASNLGAIARILLDEESHFDDAYLLLNSWLEEKDQYQYWLQSKLDEKGLLTRLYIENIHISSPIDYSSIYRECDLVLRRRNKAESEITLALTSGTPAMIAIWLLLGKGVYNTNLVQVSREHGIQEVTLPFDVSLAYLEQQDSLLKEYLIASPEVDASFAHISAKSAAMADAVALAKQVAPRNLPVLIQGPSGSGKEVIASAIHEASPRSQKAWLAVNCGAIPESLLDAELFGHTDGAFTGAGKARKGYFEQADRGTLFLDEIGELPPSAQVRLLRVLQEGEIMPVGASTPVSVDVRIIAATHRDLLEMVEHGQFREDLYYRLAVGIVILPPMSARPEDVPSLLDSLMVRVNQDMKGQPGFRPRHLSTAARAVVYQHSWPGNIRELLNTLLRASLWSEGLEITESDIQRAIVSRRPKKAELSRETISAGIDLNEVLDQYRENAIREALALCRGNATDAGKKLKLTRQVLDQQAKKLNIDKAEYQ